MIYRLDTNFYVTYALHVRKDEHDSFVLKRIDNGVFGLYDTLSENYDRSDGEIAEALDRVVNNTIGDGYHTRYISIINFWAI